MFIDEREMVVASSNASNYYCMCCGKHLSMNKKHFEEHNKSTSHLQFATLQKNMHIFKHFHIGNQCLTLVDFMLEFYHYLKVLMFFNGK
jgi:hypothetical protein